MDPISQGVLGAAAGGIVAGRRGLLVGLGAGMAPDLDVFVPVGDDPTAGWYWHRGPSHSLLAVPVLGLLCGCVFLAFRGFRRRWRSTLLAGVAGLATHAPLDALTSYGTLLFWPFSNGRVALDWMPIIDPAWTLTMAFGVAAAAISNRRWPAVAAIALALAYFAFGAHQNAVATDALRRTAAARGHDAGRVRAMPSPGALALWRGVYEHGGDLHAVGVRVSYLGDVSVAPGASRPLATEAVAEGPDELRHFRRFNWFADGRAYEVAPGVLGDGRYSGDAAGFEPLWGLDLSGDRPSRHRPGREFDLGRLLAGTAGRDARFVPANFYD